MFQSLHFHFRGLSLGFLTVHREVQQSVQGIVALYDRWKYLLESTNTSTNDEFKWTANEVKQGLRSIEYDLNDLDETIDILTD